MRSARGMPVPSVASNVAACLHRWAAMMLACTVWFLPAAGRNCCLAGVRERPSCRSCRAGATRAAESDSSCDRRRRLDTFRHQIEAPRSISTIVDACVQTAPTPAHVRHRSHKRHSVARAPDWPVAGSIARARRSMCGLPSSLMLTAAASLLRESGAADRERKNQRNVFCHSCFSWHLRHLRHLRHLGTLGTLINPQSASNSRRATDSNQSMPSLTRSNLSPYRPVFRAR